MAAAIYRWPKLVRLFLDHSANVNARDKSGQTSLHHAAVHSLDSVKLLLAAGADAVQIFDSWGGMLAPDHYRQWSLDWIFEVVSRMRKDHTPVIVFSKGANHALGDLAQVGADVVGLDWTVDLGEVRERIGEQVALQGKLDPAVLYAQPEVIRREVRSILNKFGRHPGHVFNLGHGITPGVPVPHALAFVRAVQEAAAMGGRP